MKYSLLSILFIILNHSVLHAQNDIPSNTTAYVNFNLGTSTIKPQPEYASQALTLIGCNTVITNQDKAYWHKAPNGLVWQRKNQVFKNIPYGYRIDSITNAPYYVSKYYVASPPIFLRNKSKKPITNASYDIGILTPDEFILEGEKPLQKVSFDYNILKLAKIQYIPVSFDKTSFDLWKVNVIPFKVNCKNFPWIDNKYYNGAKGASGIGTLNRAEEKTHPQQLFLPFLEKKDATNQYKEFLDCEVTLLNDVLLHHEVYFKVNGEKHYTLNLKDFYEKHKTDKNLEIKLYCDYRNELGCGCKAPKTK